VFSPNYDDEDDGKDYGSPWKSLSELKLKPSSLIPISKSKLTTTSDDTNNRLSAFDRQLLDEMRVSSPKSRLTTINEEKHKSRGLLSRNNKLSPYNDSSDYEAHAKKSK
jgi:hypothetical protein